MKALIYGIKNSIYEIVFFLLNIISNLIIRKLLIENIHIEIVALQQVLNQIITIITLVEFGISNIMVFYLYPALKKGNKRRINNIVNTFKKKYLLVALVAFAIGILVIPFLPLFVNNFEIKINYFIIFLIMLIQNVFILAFSSKKFLLQADQKSYIYLKIMIAFKIAFILTASIIIKYTNNSYLYYLIMCLFEMLTYFVISKVVDKKYDYIKENNKTKNVYDKEISKYIKSTSVSKVFGELSSSIDIFILGFLANGYILGLYSNYYSLYTSLYLVVLRVVTSFKATIAKFMETKILEYSYQVYNLFELATYIIGLLTSFAYYIFVDFIINIWLGKEYILGNNIPLLLSIQLFILIYRMSQWSTLYIKGWFSVLKITDLLSTIMNVLLSIVLYFNIGLSGVVLATIISQVIQCIIESIYVYKKFNVFNLKKILEKTILIILYILLLLLINYQIYISILILILIIIYLVILCRRGCKYVFKNKEIY